MMYTISISRRGSLVIAAGRSDRYEVLRRLVAALDSAEDGDLVELSRVDGKRFAVIGAWTGGAPYDVAEVYDACGLAYVRGAAQAELVARIAGPLSRLVGMAPAIECARNAVAVAACDDATPLHVAVACAVHHRRRYAATYGAEWSTVTDRQAAEVRAAVQAMGARDARMGAA